MTTESDQIEQLPRASAVLLARLLVPTGKSSPTMAGLRKDVAGIVGPLEDADWAEAVASLTSAGWSTALSAKGDNGPAKPRFLAMHLTGDGRTAARDRLGALADRRKLTVASIVAFYKLADPRPQVATVLLTRLYVPDANPPTIAALRASVAKVVPVDDASWDSAVASLVSAGYVVVPAPPPPAPKQAKRSPLNLTDAGRAVAQRWLGMDPVPVDLRWAEVVSKWLPAVTVPEDDRAVFRDDKRVVALLLGQMFDVGPTATVDDAIQAVVCKELGFPNLRRIDELESTVIGNRLGKTLPPLPPKDMAKQVPAAAFGLPDATAKAVRAAALKRWATGRPKPTAGDLPAFAVAVNAAAAASPTGWFGDDKVFINHVHRHMGNAMPLETFKARLVEANTAGLLQLARADLVAAMDPADVLESEVAYLTAEFHFVRVEKGRAS